MIWTVITIRRALGGKLIGSTVMREMVCTAILRLPGDLIERVTHTVWFISSQDDSWAFTFRGSDISEAHLIFLSDELLAQDRGQITYTILHEIGHVLLDHRNSLGGYIQTESQIALQERDADAFAVKYYKT